VGELTPPMVLDHAAGWTYGCRDAAGEPTDARRLDPGRLGDHVDRLYRVARSMCNSREEAEDLVQDTFVRVLKKPRFLRRDDDVAYLLRVLRNTFVSTRRRAARRPQACTPIDNVGWIEDRSAVQPEAKVDSDTLYHAIGSLPDPFRDALIAVDVVGLSYGEASRALRVREATITTRLHRARQKVADTLQDTSTVAPAVRPTRPSAPPAEGPEMRG
jgi:RNA polymerase sigma-70 factor, ECF subfamily